MPDISFKAPAVQIWKKKVLKIALNSDWSYFRFSSRASFFVVFKLRPLLVGNSGISSCLGSTACPKCSNQILCCYLPDSYIPFLYPVQIHSLHGQLQPQVYRMKLIVSARLWVIHAPRAFAFRLSWIVVVFLVDIVNKNSFQSCRLWQMSIETVEVPKDL